MTSEDLKNMKLHEVVHVPLPTTEGWNLRIIRVVEGWIYETPMTGVFVPETIVEVHNQVDIST